MEAVVFWVEEAVFIDEHVEGLGRNREKQRGQLVFVNICEFGILGCLGELSSVLGECLMSSEFWMVDAPGRREMR